MIGIVQGRLTFSGKKLQSFPKDPYNEFGIASKLKYDFIEFFAERNYNKKNPIWTDEGINRYIFLSKKKNLKLYSLCDDFIINNSLNSKKTLKYIFKILERLKLLKVKNYIIPMYGKSRYFPEKIITTAKSLKAISNKCIKMKINLLIESNMLPKDFKELKKKVNSKNLFFLFDTGNRSILKRNLIEDLIQFGSNIKHIHLKDKNINKENVLIGKGLVDFNLIFSNLKKIKYKGSFAVESKRGKNIFKQAKKNYMFFKKLTLKHKI